LLDCPAHRHNGRDDIARIGAIAQSARIRIALAGLRDDVLENLKAVGAEEDLGPIAPHRIY
jgi:hypothetical protein